MNKRDLSAAFEAAYCFAGKAEIDSLGITVDIDSVVPYPNA